MRLKVLLACLFISAPLGAAYRPVGGAFVEVFGPAKTWVRTPARVLYQADPEGLQLRLMGLGLGRPLHARLQVDQLPGYQPWLAQRQAEGGAAWTALEGLLKELAGQPLVLLTHTPLAPGPTEVLAGLRQGARFKLYARLKGSLEAMPDGLVFSPQEADFESTQAGLAWRLLAPLARAQARRVAGQKP